VLKLRVREVFLSFRNPNEFKDIRLKYAGVKRSWTAVLDYNFCNCIVGDCYRWIIILLHGIKMDYHTSQGLCLYWINCAIHQTSLCRWQKVIFSV
jgi:hypothetical protein